MRTTGASAVVSAVLLAGWCGAAEAYRPFDGTDAAVVEPGDIEIELGPVEYLRDGAERVLFAPDLRLNYGFAPDWEITLENRVAHGLTIDAPATSLVGNDALLKGVLREGSLQHKAGPSIATEFGILLPGVHDERGTGATLAGILSQQSAWGTLHFNSAIALTRQQHADYFIGIILEGPADWPVRPVAEIFYDRDVGQLRTRSALIGAIWQVKDNIAVDFGLRGARINDHTAGEFRAGVTFAFGAVDGRDVSLLQRIH
jgi:hypothetical protein